MSESETKGRCRSEMAKCSSRYDLFTSQEVLADAIDRIAADVAEIKEATLPQTTEERDCAIRERDEARAEVERLRAELTAARAETQRIQDEADDREQTEKVKRLNAEIEKTHRTLLNRTWERDIATAEAERLRAMLAAQPAAAGWLTEVERQTLLYLRSILSSWGIAHNYPEVKEFYGNHLECLDAILDRAGSPPVVEVPAMPYRQPNFYSRQEAECYRAALDKAGVAWKEVPRE